MKPTKEEVETFLYEGDNNMINFNTNKIPNCPPSFKAELKLKGGKTITAPSEWRKKIWKWWHEARKYEIEKDVLIQAGRSMVAKPHCMGE